MRALSGLLAALAIGGGCSSNAPSPPVPSAATPPPAPAPQGPDGDVFASAQPFAANEHLETIPSTRTDASGHAVNLAFDVVVPPKGATPSRVVVLLVGGGGALGLTKTGFAQGANNFVARTRQLYASAGFAAAVPDVPSDRTDLDGFRNDAGHADDLRAILAWLRASYGAPIWLVGTSRGTISAANAAIRLAGAPGLAGVVLTSSVTVVPKGATDKESIDEAGLAKTSLPVWIGHDDADACGASPFAGAKSLGASVGTSTFVAFHGGAETGSDPCGALTFHGFYGPSASESAPTGMDDDVVPAILRFVSAH